MDLSGPASLTQISLRLSAEGRRAIYLAQDLASGRIFTVPRDQALALHRVRAATGGGGAEARAAVGKDDAVAVQGLLHLVQRMRVSDALNAKPFNPVFTSIPLVDLGRFQPRFAGHARALVRPAYAWVRVALLVLCLPLGMRNDWAILSAFRGVFSLEALLTFGLIAPVLKLVHEFGHFLVATRFGVRVRKGGFYLIALYPMPFVDCTEADVAAGRRERILISLSGIIVDVTIGLLAFIAWHFVGGSYLQTLLGHVFVFSTLNSILFNANPLIKLDGYYALVDAVGARNLATRAQATLRDARTWAMSLGSGGERPRDMRQAGLVLYALASFLYRLNILLVIAMALLPQYLGLGAVLAAWGGLVMFVSPLLADRPNAPEQAGRSRVHRRVWGSRLALVAVGLAALVFVEIPFRTTVPVRLDLDGRHTLTTATAGFVAGSTVNGSVMAGERLVQLENPVLEEEVELLERQIRGAELAHDAVQGADQAQALAAADQLAALREQMRVLKSEVDGLDMMSPSEGTFVPFSPLPVGKFVESGAILGWHLPATGPSVVSGEFPEAYFDKFKAGVEKVELRLDGHYHDLAPEHVELQPVVRVDAGSGGRSFVIKATYEAAPVDVAGAPGHVRLVFASEPLWSHLRFRFEALVSKFRDSQLIDLTKYLD